MEQRKAIPNHIQPRIEAAQEIQKRNPPSSKAWKDAHKTIRALVLEYTGNDIDGVASHRGAA